MAARFACAVLMVAGAASPAFADDAYPFAGVFSALEATAEKNYGMDKFTCLASFQIQHSDGTYTAYHIDSNAFGKGVTFHAYEIGACSFDAVKNMEHCKVTKSNFGDSEYFIQHKGGTGGVMLVDQVSFSNPLQLTEMAVRKCPFDEAKIAPFLSPEFSNYSRDDFGWTLYRWLPFNPDFGPKIAKALGIGAP